MAFLQNNDISGQFVDVIQGPQVYTVYALYTLCSYVAPALYPLPPTRGIERPPAAIADTYIRVWAQPVNRSDCNLWSAFNIIAGLSCREALAKTKAYASTAVIGNS